MSEPSAAQPAWQRLHATVYGSVQGVGFRFFVLQQAVALDVTGWVRNLAGGMVEVVAEGNTSDLETLLTALHEGPSAASVRDVKWHYSPASAEFREFHIRY